jgi:hypothetical protein
MGSLPYKKLDQSPQNKSTDNASYNASGDSSCWRFLISQKDVAVGCSMLY